MSVGAPDYQTNVRMVEQLRALFDMLQWYTDVGLDKTFTFEMTLTPGTGDTEWLYRVPDGRRLMLTELGFSRTARGLCSLLKDLNAVFFSRQAAWSPFVTSFSRPARYEAGEDVFFYAYNDDTVAGDFSICVAGCEYEVSSSFHTSKPSTASEAYKEGLFNIANLRRLDGGVCEYRISGVMLRETYTFKARNLYRDDEEVVEDERVETVKFPRRLV